MTGREIEALREQNVRLRTGLEQALMFIQEVALGAHERVDAEVLVPVLTEALMTD